MIKTILQILANISGIWKTKQELNNQPKVQTAKAAQKNTDERNRMERDTAGANLGATERDLAE